MSNYIPIPPRVWSRVQNQCTYITPDDEYLSAYIPLTGQTVSQGQANFETQMINKGNVLQYKGNSARLTKTQKYSQLARMAGPNRTKVFATQSQTYTNPNTTGLLRKNYDVYSFPNQIVGAPNNISGPFAYGIQNPYDCSGNVIQDGGTLVCGTYANPCSGEIYIQGPTTASICNPASASNVPGSSILCWNNKVQTWFPRQRYFMNNSTSKWPQGYKGFTSAATPNAPFVTVSFISEQNVCLSLATISWIILKKNCILLPITNYNIYINGNLYQTVPSTVNSIQVDLSVGNYSIYVQSLSSSIVSEQSNIVNLIVTADNIILNITDLNITIFNNGQYQGYLLQTTLTQEQGGYGYAEILTCGCLESASALIVGGGGGGASGYYPNYNSNYWSAGAGGGGGGVVLMSNCTINTNSTIKIQVGAGGKGNPIVNQTPAAGSSGTASSILLDSYYQIAGGGGAGYGGGSTGPGGGSGGIIQQNSFPTATQLGYGGSGGGGAYVYKGSGNAGNAGIGGSGYTSNGNYGTSNYTQGGNGGDQVGSINPIVVPGLGSFTIGGGAGGGGKSIGGGAGVGTGGTGSGSSSNSGASSSVYGGGGGGGAAEGNPGPGGNGGQGLVILWWPIIPLAPVSLTASASGNQGVLLTWTAPTYSCPDAIQIDSYNYYYKQDTQTSYNGPINIGIPSPLQYLVTGLTPEILYDFKVTALNDDVIEGIPAIATATPIGIPSAPSISLVSGDQTITVTWDQPDDNGSAITSYTLYYTPDGSSPSPITTVISPYTLPGLTNGTTYTLNVSATNAVGEGPQSASQTAIPAGLTLALTFSLEAYNNGIG